MFKNKIGSSLIEVILAMVIIAVAVVVTLDFYKHCQKNFILSSKLRMAAADFARETVEEMYWLDPSNPNLNTTTEAVSKALPSTGDFAELYDRYAGARTYTIAQETDANYKVVEVKVSWSP